MTFGFSRSAASISSVREHVAAAAAAATRPTPTDRFQQSGFDPLTLLILGGGVAVGHGATTRSDALDGQLGRRIGLGGRGVSVWNVGTHDARLRDQVGVAGEQVRLHRPDFLVWCPSYVEMTDRHPTAGWKPLLRRLSQLVPTGLIALELPVPTGSGEAAVAAAPVIGRINARLRSAQRALPQLTVVAPPPVPVRALGQPLFDADYYSSLTDLVLRAAPWLLTSPGAPALRQTRLSGALELG